MCRRRHGHSGAAAHGPAAVASPAMAIAATLVSVASLAVAYVYRQKQKRQAKTIEELEEQLRNQAQSGGQTSRSVDFSAYAGGKKARSSSSSAAGTAGTAGTKPSTDGKENEKQQNTQKKQKKLTLEDTHALYEDGLRVKPIGTVRSIYRLCVGTPRQGLLAPHARGRIDLLNVGNSFAQHSVQGLEGYSHIWVVFIFHLNTQAKSGSSRITTKVAPPALGGKKVGILATRTPHRFNPVGLTLCKLDRVEVEGQNVSLHISGLDLVDGTPVLDIKPFVPVYDTVPPEQVSLPPWVSGGLATQRKVTVTKLAKDELRTILEKHPDALEFYGPQANAPSASKIGGGDAASKPIDATVDDVLGCIQQVLSMDVRSSWQTRKAREGKFQAERAGRVVETAGGTNMVEASEDDASSPTLLCTQQLDNLLVHYSVSESADRKRDTSEGSGAEDTIFVKTIQLLNEPTSSVTSTVRTLPEDKASKSPKVALKHTQYPVQPNNQGKGTLNLPKLKKVVTPTADAKSKAEEDAFHFRDYRRLKKYWNTAATNNTPDGVLPDRPRTGGPGSSSHHSSRRGYGHSDGASIRSSAPSSAATTPTSSPQSHARANRSVMMSGSSINIAKLTAGDNQVDDSKPVEVTTSDESANQNQLPSVVETRPMEADTQDVGGFKVAKKKADEPVAPVSATTADVGGFKVAKKVETPDAAAAATTEDVGGFKIAKKADPPSPATTADVGGFKVAKKADETAPVSTTDVGGFKVAKKVDEPVAAATAATTEDVGGFKIAKKTETEIETPDAAAVAATEDVGGFKVAKKMDEAASPATADVGGFKVAKKTETEIETPDVAAVTATEDIGGFKVAKKADEPVAVTTADVGGFQVAKKAAPAAAVAASTDVGGFKVAKQVELPQQDIETTMTEEVSGFKVAKKDDDAAPTHDESGPPSSSPNGAATTTTTAQEGVAAEDAKAKNEDVDASDVVSDQKNAPTHASDDWSLVANEQSSPEQSSDEPDDTDKGEEVDKAGVAESNKVQDADSAEGTANVAHEDEAEKDTGTAKADDANESTETAQADSE